MLALLLAAVVAVIPGKTRVYYIAADELRWNYVPGGTDGLTGKPYQAIGSFATADAGRRTGASTECPASFA